MWADVVGYVRQIRFVDLLAAAIPVACIVFILFVVLQG